MLHGSFFNRMASVCFGLKHLRRSGKSRLSETYLNLTPKTFTIVSKINYLIKRPI